MHQFTGMWLNPNSRGSRLRIWQPWGCNSLHAHHLTAPGLRGNSRPQRLKIAEPSGCKSRGADQPSLVELRLGKPACGSQGIADRFGSNPNSLGSASLPTPTNFGMSTGQADRASVLTSACFRASGASPRHSAPLQAAASARSSKRAVRLISGVALDQCRVPERYRTRAPL